MLMVRKRNIWWSIGDGNRTFGDDPVGEVKEIRELLDESDAADAKEPKL
jgi:hypothetical protein